MRYCTVIYRGIDLWCRNSKGGGKEEEERDEKGHDGAHPEIFKVHTEYNKE